MVLADASLTMESSTPAPASTFYVKDGMVRIENTDSEGNVYPSLFDNARQTFVVIDNQRRMYMEVNQQKAEEAKKRMEAQMGPIVEQMKAELPDMPEKQRKMTEQRIAQMEQSMAGRSGQQKGPTIEVENTGQKLQVNGITCTVHSMSIDAEKIREICIAEQAATGMSEDDYSTLLGMFKSMNAMAGTMRGGPMTGSGDAALPDIPGLPMETKDLKAGISSKVAKISNDTLSADLFQVPAGYQQMDPLAGDPEKQSQ
jgi:hypothetical protein